jgi:hypothetical protein
VPFLNDLKLKSIRGTAYREVLRSLVYVAIDGEYIVAPLGFVTDYASIPKILHSWVNPGEGIIRDAAVMHDALYEFGYTIGYSRARCDRYFYEAMQGLGMSRAKATIIWLGVRLFGASHYNKFRSIYFIHTLPGNLRLPRN